MPEERFSDLAAIAMYYSERFEEDEICQTFVKAHPKRLSQASLFTHSPAGGMFAIIFQIDWQEEGTVSPTEDQSSNDEERTPQCDQTAGYMYSSVCSLSS
ncbi:unnamed protein product [Porites evermanni]|uniref:Uncharacterized protein n=1 Tax=Porites evermanni TaxID=104178 RepID=A0ABN8LHA2_9CNID|nr:unnamed protein product [Porites evermanni]